MTATDTPSTIITQKIATELALKPQQVNATISLLDEGSTVPFISRYRKEATGGLDDLQLRDLELRLRYLCEMSDRIETIVESIKEQEKLTPALEKQIRSAETKSSGKESSSSTKKSTRSARPTSIERKPTAPAVGNFGALLQDAANKKK
tara:strand:- start:39 stop:485 length:447 start_codon:yes stop_codon:yes gene_type:complete